ncbi:DNA translocase FtsK [Peribacillus cavernae]|uniref:DNA translocase FtsK n=1 Tax=Peribacillus cavernae TaxID=1674310 RepID=A0A433HUL0_9BACI|nr:DNA translocase FtsK [Peribacillus cavernae]
MDFSKLKAESKPTYLPRPAQSMKMNDPDAKVLYQYPKGQFKFPVIPDRERLRRNRQDEQPVRTAGKKQKAEHQKKHETRKKSNSASGEDQRENKLKKIQPSNVPFRPTEIPSPIYGFTRPEKKPTATKEAVESQFENKISILENEPFEIPAIYHKNEGELSEPNPSSEEIETERKETIDKTIPENGVFSEVAVSAQAPVLPADTPETVIAEAGMEMDTKLQTEIDAEFHEDERAVPDGSSFFSAELVDIDTDTEAVQLNAVEENHDYWHEESAPVSVIEERVPVTSGIESDVWDEPIQEQTEKREDVSRKKHIPFNVMMTKQDRDRWIQLQSEASQKKSLFEDEEAGVYENVSTGMQQSETITENRIEAVSDHDEEPPFYAFPSIELLTPPAYAQNDQEWLEEQSQLLNDTLKNFNVRAKVVNVTQGPAVTRFEVQPEPGVKVNKITNLTDDIKLSLAAQDIRMEAPIPGKHTIGIEIPNRKSKPVFLREVLDSEAFKKDRSPLAVALGLDISGQPIVTDLKKMPHGLIAGATGSGKSVCINTMLISLLYKATPQELKLLLIDPKMVELAPYNRIPHLVSPVITDVKAATVALKWAVEEMERRYELFVHAGVRDISRFNELADKAGQYSDKLPFIVVIIDELADLMMMSPADVEEAISRIAQKARACGIHLIVATQRPSVDVITGLIKANIPTRIAFSVSSQVDSRTIIDSGGAEKLLGKGDMLFAENGSSKTVRLQGTFVSDEEIDQVVNHVKNEQAPAYLFEQEELLSKAQVTEETDELFYEACEFAVNQSGASASSLQRRFHVGYNRASRLIEMMERQGILSESRGSKPRDVLISQEELEFILETSGGN